MNTKQERQSENRTGKAREPIVARLRDKLATLEGLSGNTAHQSLSARRLDFGVRAIDGHIDGLRGGLRTGRLHEFGGNAALAAVVILVARARGDVLWCTPQGGCTQEGQRHALYPPGLLSLGLDPRRLIHAHARTRDDLYWAAEDALRSKALSTVVVETASAMSLTVARRLQLAASTGGICALILNEAMNQDAHSICPVAQTRWWVNHRPCLEARQGHPPDNTQNSISGFELALIRNRSGRLHQWQVEWDETAHHLRLAAQDRDRSHHQERRHIAR